MFEARLVQGSILKKIIEALKDLVGDANFDCSSTGIALQAMDSSHVALVSLHLNCEGFEHFRCDRRLSLGINLNSMSKILKIAGNEDTIVLKAEDQADVVNFIFENAAADKLSNFELKLQDIDAEHLGIPDKAYSAIVKMPSAEFQRICRDLTIIGDSVNITASKEGVKFSVAGDIGGGSINLKQTASESDDNAVVIHLVEEVSLTFALRYLNFFTKATSLSGSMVLQLHPDMPLLVSYTIENLGVIRFYLAPKVDEGKTEEESVQVKNED